MFEGNRPRVEWLAAEASKVAAESQTVTAVANDEDAGDALLDFLVAIEEPGADRNVGIAHVVVTPSEAAHALEDLALRLRACEGIAFRALADELSGVVVVRWSGPASRLSAPLADVVETAKRFAGNARLVHLPGPIRGEHPRDLTPDPNAALAERIRAAFDPRGVFSSGAAAPAGVAR
jgi:FAD/FMN-containing dehydrogenase